MVSIVLGQYDDDELIYKGHVTLGVSGHDFARIKSLPINERHPFAAPPKGNESVVWVTPVLVCSVKYMEKTSAVACASQYSKDFGMINRLGNVKPDATPE